MSKQVPDSTIDDIYNLAFGHLYQSLAKDKIRGPYEIWLREGTTPSHYGFSSIPEGKTPHDVNVKPIRVVATWVSSPSEAGRILRRMVKVAVEYEEWLMADAEDSNRSTDDPPAPAPEPEPEPDPQTPGVG